MGGSLEEGKIYLSRSEVAEIFKVSPNTITRWADAGKLSYIRTLGGHRRYEAATILELARQMTGEEEGMEQASFYVHNLYGDHHVTAVKRLLQQLDGVVDVFASAAFHEVVVSFDPAEISAADIESALATAGYPAGSPDEQSSLVLSLAPRSPLSLSKGPVEGRVPPGREVFGLAGEAVPRHARAYSEATTTSTVHWALPEWRSARPLPCPGFEYRTSRLVR